MFDVAFWHWSVLVQNILSRDYSGLETVGKHPRLNTIETLREIIKIKGTQKQPSNTETLREAIKNI